MILFNYLVTWGWLIPVWSTLCWMRVTGDLKDQLLSSYLTDSTLMHSVNLGTPDERILPFYYRVHR